MLTAEARDSTGIWASGEVRRLEYLGHEALATIAIGPMTITARLSGSSDIRPGDRRCVGLPLDRLVWFDDLSDRSVGGLPDCQ